jgi:hypothetical protein
VIDEGFLGKKVAGKHDTDGMPAQFLSFRRNPFVEGLLMAEQILTE